MSYIIKERFEIEYSQEKSGERTEILVDTKTGVYYLFHSDGRSGGLTVMVDTEGKPISNTILYGIRRI